MFSTRNLCRRTRRSGRRHVSSDDEDNYGLLTIELVFENLARWYAGKPLRNVVDAGLRY